MGDPSGLGKKILNELYSNTSEAATNFWEENIDKVSKHVNSDDGSSTVQNAVMGIETEAAHFTAQHLKKIDLGTLEFTHGSRVMSNKEVKLPDKSWRVQKKGYEEVHVPAMKNVEKNVKLIEIQSLPQWAQEAFGKKIKRLNALQSKVYNSAFNSGENLLVCAPTGQAKQTLRV